MKLKFVKNPTTGKTMIQPLKPAVKAQPAMCAHGMLPGFCVVPGCPNTLPAQLGATAKYKLCGHNYTLGNCPDTRCPHYGIGSPYSISTYPNYTPNYKSWGMAPPATRLFDPAEKALLVQVLNEAIEVQGMRHMTLDPMSPEGELAMAELRRLIKIRRFTEDEL